METEHYHIISSSEVDRWKRNIIVLYQQQKSEGRNGTLLYFIISRIRKMEMNIVILYHQQRSKDGNGTLLYFVINRSRKIEMEHYHIISSAEFE